MVLIKILVITYLYELYRFHQEHKNDEDFDEDHELSLEAPTHADKPDSELKKK